MPPRYRRLSIFDSKRQFPITSISIRGTQITSLPGTIFIWSVGGSAPGLPVGYSTVYVPIRASARGDGYPSAPQPYQPGQVFGYGSAATTEIIVDWYLVVASSSGCIRDCRSGAEVLSVEVSSLPATPGAFTTWDVQYCGPFAGRGGSGRVTGTVGFGGDFSVFQRLRSGLFSQLNRGSADRGIRPEE